MPKNHVEVHVKNVIKLDHSKKTNKKRKPTKKGRKPTKKGELMPLLARPNNTQYDKNAKTYYTPGSSLILPQENKYGYDKNPRIIHGMNPNDTNSTNLTQQLLLEHQRKNEQNTKELLQNQHKQFKDGFKEYHTHYIEPLHKYQNELHERVNNIHDRLDQMDNVNDSNLYQYYVGDNIDDYVTNPILNLNNEKEESLVKSPFKKLFKYEKTKLRDKLREEEYDKNPILDSNNADNLTQPFEEIFVPESNSDLESEEGELIEHKGEPIDDIIEEEVIPASQTDKQNISGVDIETVDEPIKTEKPINKTPFLFSQIRNLTQAIYIYKKLFNDEEYENMDFKPMKKKIREEAIKQKLGKTILIPTRLL